MAGFVQIIDIETSRIDEVRGLADKFRSEREGSEGETAPVRLTFTADRDRPGHYVNIVEFPSYEVAMENSNAPETQQFAAALAELCDAPPQFRNLDVLESWQPEL
jgi:quinol monooxygenase YgiN